MQHLEPFYHWRHLYMAEEDPASPFYGKVYSEFEFSDTIYNYYIHPQWDSFDSPTLYLKILFVDYEEGFTIIEFLGEWNDAIGNDIMNIVKIDMKSGVGWYNAPKELMSDAWSPNNPSNSQFKISSSNQSNLQISDWLVEDGSYLRIKSVQLGYTLPKHLLRSVNNLRFWVSGYNLFTFTKYTGLDPEIGSNSPLSMGVDQGYYPVAKSWMFGVNLSF